MYVYAKWKGTWILKGKDNLYFVARIHSANNEKQKISGIRFQAGHSSTKFTQSLGFKSHKNH